MTWAAVALSVATGLVIVAAYVLPHMGLWLGCDDEEDDNG